MNRYDGYNFKIFRHDPFDSASISGNNITAISEDHLGYLWVGAGKEGLNRFDPAAETFHRFRHDPGNPNSLSHNKITSIREAPSGDPEKNMILWVGTQNGLNRLNLPVPADSGSLDANDQNTSLAPPLRYAVTHFFS